MPGYEAMIVDDDGRPVPQGELGNLRVKGDSTMAYYWNRHEKTKSSLFGHWIQTGDKYYQDADGYFWYCGRANDMLKVGGIWVSPVEVEATLIGHPAVLEAGVVGSEDEEQLVKPRAFVVVKEGETATQEELIEWAKAKLATYKLPSEIDTLVKEAQRAWEEKLSLVKIRGATETQNRIYYTALYRVLQMPTLFNDHNGQYMGFDRKIHTATNHEYYTDMSIWDTFRTTHPLYTLIAPREQRNFLMSLVKMTEQGGWLSPWPSGHGYSNSMLGTPADILVAECWLKGLRDFDVETAYAAMRRAALAPTPTGSAFSGRQGVDLYLKYKYCPPDLMNKTVSRTLEYGWADSAIARLAM